MLPIDPSSPAVENADRPHLQPAIVLGLIGGGVPTSIRSTDNGKTWSAPLAIQRDWVGALRAMVVLQSGRIVIATMAIQPWEHVIVVYYSDDQGKSWTKTQTITMEGSKINDHDGAMEPNVDRSGGGRLDRR